MARHILIIDDDSRNIFALTAVLKAKRFECISASSASEGISLLRSGTDIGIILMDMMMPDMDGYEAISRIKSDVAFASTPIVAVTAQAMVGDRERCLEAGADGYISKPVDVDQLLLLIEKFIKD